MLSSSLLFTASATTNILIILMNTIVHLCSHEWKGSWKKGEEDHLAEVKKSTRNLRTRERVIGILTLNTKFCAFERQKKSGRDIDYYYQILHWQSKIETLCIYYILSSVFIPGSSETREKAFWHQCSQVATYHLQQCNQKHCLPNWRYV